MSAPRILVVDDEKLIRFALREHLTEAGYRVAEASTVAAIAGQLAAGVDLVLLDRHLPDGDGLEVLKQLHADDPELLVIMLTADSSVDAIVGAMNAGAFHYVTKPVNLDELSHLVERALETTRLRREVQALRSGQDDDRGLGAIVGESPVMTRTRDLLRRVAASPASTVLITGETGTGKDLAARVVHELSDRSAAPFMNITCTALPDTLFESELFGHERGAFTDARQQRRGLLEQSNGGTVFLDEIAELPPGLQAKLLRFLEDKTVRRIGGTADIAVDVRVVAATNRVLQDMVAAGTFREDLYYRLQVLPIELPALRDRAGDVPLLVKFFADSFARRFHKPVLEIDAAAMAALEAHTWPGNVRELRNTVERAVLLSEGNSLKTDDFLLPSARGPVSRKPAAVPSSPAPAVAPPVAGDADADAGSTTGFVLPPDGVSLEAVERDLVVQALARTHNNQTRAAALLGINRDQIRYRIQKFNIELKPD
ncbi:MAG: sigma-54-dependent transcriptional regulator [Planctomycetota bacterium]